MKPTGETLRAATMNVTITPWKRFGHDRLYLTVGERKIGYRDNVTGEDHADSPDDTALLTALIQAHLTPSHSTARRSGVGPADASAPALATEKAWSDLAVHRPGQMVRERAAEEWTTRRAERPVRAILGRVLDVHTDERAWRIGADGEEAVGSQLEKLVRKNPQWRVLHSVPVGERGSDIDHLVIGPGGVFTVNTKHHPGAKVWVGGDQLRVNGHTHPYIRNSRFETKRAARLLTASCGFDVRVDALIVLWGVEDIAVKTEPGEKDGSEVHVKYRRQSVRWLAKKPAVLTADQVEAIYEQARRSTTWS